MPKDGPSAGITMTTALASLVSGKAVAPTIAMTGEVSLRGVVTPIGGLPEKLMAASRAGIQTVFIPMENEDDLDEVPQEVKDKVKLLRNKQKKGVRHLRRGSDPFYGCCIRRKVGTEQDF